ncbi:hypothetical protein HQ585_14215 [candidate division KSB1 bacterium]|nr:hypothetical protein [candidate division KSB1 bacterium]
MKVKLVGSFVLLISAILTMIPRAAATHECVLGYKAFCTYAPFTTLILILPIFSIWYDEGRKI